MAEREGADGTATAWDRRTDRLTRWIDRFAADHGGAADAIVEHLGERGARIVLVAEDGTWGDLVAPTLPLAEAAASRSRATVREDFAGEVAARVRTGPYEWSRMAGLQIGGPANT